MVVLHHPYRSGEDVLGRSVVLLQSNHRRVLKYLGEIEYVLDLGASEAVYGLILVPHDAEVVLRTVQLLEKQKLSGVGILILVHQDDAEAILHPLLYLRIRLEKLYRPHDEVSEIGVPSLKEPLLIEPVDLIESLIRRDPS